VAPDAGWLIAARAVQGVGGALISPQVLSIIQLQIADRDRPRALGLFATTLAFGAVAGQVIGGALVSADILGWGWRTIFLVNLPIGAGLVPLAWRTLAETKAPSPRPIDLFGTLALGGGTFLLVLPSVLGQERGWPAWTLGLYAAGVVVLLAGIAHLRRRPPGHGVLDLGILRSRSVAAGFACIFLGTAAYGGFLFSLGLFLQQVHGFSALHSGLTFVPFAAGFAAASLTFVKLPQGFRERAPIAGLAGAALGYALLAVLVEGGTWRAGPAVVLMVVAGGGYGWGFSPIMTAALARVPRANAADASGAMSTINQLGYVAGVSVFGSYFLTGRHTATVGAAGHALASVYLGLAVVAALASVAAVVTLSSGRREVALGNA
jgi:predicted MFS family arabinose efflux permease